MTDRITRLVTDPSSGQPKITKLKPLPPDDKPPCQTCMYWRARPEGKYWESARNPPEVCVCRKLLGTYDTAGWITSIARYWCRGMFYRARGGK